MADDTLKSDTEAQDTTDAAGEQDDLETAKDADDAEDAATGGTQGASTTLASNDAAPNFESSPVSAPAGGPNFDNTPHALNDAAASSAAGSAGSAGRITGALGRLLDQVETAISPPTDYVRTTAATARDGPTPSAETDAHAAIAQQDAKANAFGSGQRPNATSVKAIDDQIQTLAQKMAHRTGFDAFGWGHKEDNAKLAALLTARQAAEHSYGIDISQYLLAHPEANPANVTAVRPNTALANKITGKPIFTNTVAPRATAAGTAKPVFQTDADTGALNAIDPTTMTAKPVMTSKPNPALSPNFVGPLSPDIETPASIMAPFVPKQKAAETPKTPTPHNIPDNVPFYIDSTGKQVKNPGYVSPSSRQATKADNTPAKATPDQTAARTAWTAWRRANPKATADRVAAQRKLIDPDGTLLGGENSQEWTEDPVSHVRVRLIQK